MVNRRSFLKGLAALAVAPFIPKLPTIKSRQLRGLTRSLLVIDELAWYPPPEVSAFSGSIPCDGRLVSRELYPDLYKALANNQQQRI